MKVVTETRHGREGLLIIKFTIGKYENMKINIEFVNKDL
jgi:hypothetical protein